MCAASPSVRVPLSGRTPPTSDSFHRERPCLYTDTPRLTVQTRSLMRFEYQRPLFRVAYRLASGQPRTAWIDVLHLNEV